MTGRVSRFHFLARESANDGKLTALPDGRYESGNWRVAQRVAATSKGAEIHLHERQDSVSWIAGTIDDWAPHRVEAGRIVFRFKRDDGLRRADPNGWGTGAEKKYARG